MPKSTDERVLIILLALIASPRSYTEFDHEGNTRLLKDGTGTGWQGWNSLVHVARQLDDELVDNLINRTVKVQHV